MTIVKTTQLQNNSPPRTLKTQVHCNPYSSPGIHFRIHSMHSLNQIPYNSGIIFVTLNSKIDVLGKFLLTSAATVKPFLTPKRPRINQAGRKAHILTPGPTPPTAKHPNTKKNPTLVQVETLPAWVSAAPLPPASPLWGCGHSLYPYMKVSILRRPACPPNMTHQSTVPYRTLPQSYHFLRAYRPNPPKLFSFLRFLPNMT